MSEPPTVSAGRDIAAAFAFAHALFRKPSAEQHDWLLSDECKGLWSELSESLDGLPSELEVPAGYDDYAECYIATYDVGTPSPPAPLIESHYNKREPVPRILHENILFYRQFGLQLRDSALESSDHLRHQLEFVQHLLEYRAQLQESGQLVESDQVARALTDYVKRHLLSWLPEAIRCADDAPLRFARPALMLAEGLARFLVEASE